ncbi:MAG: DUF4142 domain-containing protein [Verrucomicrobiota bacterium]|jgi:putative membrane protein
MKTRRNSRTRLARFFKTGTALGATMFAASALHAQVGGFFGPIQEIGFLQDAARADQTEIALANIAEAKSQNATVKEWAQTQRINHQQDFAQLQPMAQAIGISLSTSPGWLNQREINRLQAANAADFDKEYTEVMLKAQVKCIKRFEKAASELEQPEVKQYALNALPTLRSQLRQEEDTANSVGVEKSTISSILRHLPSEDKGLASR